MESKNCTYNEIIGISNGDCCCNCTHQKRLMKHPQNKLLGNGSISEQMGFICSVIFEDRSNEGSAIFFENGHGICELHVRR